MKIINVEVLSKQQKSQILAIWNNEYPKRLNYQTLADFEAYLQKLEDQHHILVIDESEKVWGWYFHFMRDGERWFAIILDSKLQGQGFGTHILNLAKFIEPTFNGWVMDKNDLKQNGEVYKSPLEFYLKNGFKLLPDVRLEIPQMSAVKIRWES